MDDLKFKQAREILSQAEKVAVFSGAGLSAESGISTFRGNEPDAYWSRFDPMQLASVQGFAEDPANVIAWYNWRRKKLARAEPNPAHLALAAQPGLINITQNVDNLLERAGVPETRVLHLHGSIGKDRCMDNCGYEESIELSDPPDLRNCANCGAPMRPSVVWFGEMLPEQIWLNAMRVCQDTDCLLVIGTSGSVYPAARLVEVAAGGGSNIIVINPEPNPHGQVADIELNATAARVLPKLLAGLALKS
jgi:NAD-dependent deacetylase